MKNKIILTVGVSCSGKTTWAKEYMKNNKKTYYVSRDVERETMFGEYRMGSHKEEKAITLIMQNKVDCLLMLGDVIVDNTHLSMNYIQPYLDRYSNVEFSVLDLISENEFVSRNTERHAKTGKLIPYEVFEKQCKQFNALPELVGKNTTSGCKTDRRIGRVLGNEIRRAKNSLPNCIICDLDGTLSLMNGRSPFEGKDCESDVVHTPVATLLDVIAMNNVTCEEHATGTRVTTILMSGRNSDKGGRTATKKWLHGNKITFDELHMRKEGDQRSDTIIKKEMYEEHIKGKYNVLFCLDDRPSVIRLWDSLGLAVFDVHPASGEF